MKKWEYTFYYLNFNNDLSLGGNMFLAEEEANKLGADSWELVNMQITPDIIYLSFKRLLND